MEVGVGLLWEDGEVETSITKDTHGRIKVFLLKSKPNIFLGDFLFI